MSDDMVRLIVDGRPMGMVDRAQFERDYADAQPIRDAIARDIAQLVSINSRPSVAPKEDKP